VIAQAAAELETPGHLIVALTLAGSGAAVLVYLVWRHLDGRPLLGRHPAPFGEVDAGPLLLLWLGVLVLYQVGTGLAVGSGLGLAGGAAGIVLALAATGLAYKHVVRPLLRPRGSPAQRTGWGLLVLWAALPIMTGIFWVLQSLGLPSTQPQVELIRQREPGWVAMVLFAVVVAPLAEEIGFRGMLYPALRRLGGPYFALVATAVLFGVVHWPPTTWAPLAVFGVFLAYLVEATGSVLPCIAAHVVFNAITVLQLLLL
jgi:membrane protease YdiL (CAAX protease family)